MSTPCNMPVARQQSISVNPDRVAKMPLHQSFLRGTLRVGLIYLSKLDFCYYKVGLLLTLLPTSGCVYLRLPLKTNLASEFDCKRKLGVESAFIYAPLHEDAYMHSQSALHNDPPGHCVKLLKSLYGRKQSLRNCSTYLHDFIISISFRRSHLDHCMYHVVIDSHTLSSWLSLWIIYCLHRLVRIRLHMSNLYSMHSFVSRTCNLHPIS